MKRRNGWWALLWAGCIFVTSSTVVQSRSFVHAVASTAPGSITEPGFAHFWSRWWWVFVKGYHVFEFALLTFLLWRWLKPRPVWVPALISIVYAATDELHQIMVPARGARFTDWMIDCAGVMAGAIAILAWVSLSSGKTRRDDSL
ncbi:MAG: VanZ family protein [Fimbriimonadaceae bacterium]